MVEFIRDVIIVVAILATLIAVAFHPNRESDASRSADTLTSRISVSGSITSGENVIVEKAAAPAALTK